MRGRCLPGLLALLALLAGPLRASPEHPPVLVLNSYGPGRPLVDRFLESFVESMVERGWSADDLLLEHLGTNAKPSPGEHQARLDLLRRQIQHHRPALLVTLQQPALEVLRELRGVEGLPLLVVVGAPQPDWQWSGPVQMLGSRLDHRGTLQLGLNLFPGSRRVLLVCGTSPSDRLREQAMRDAIAQLGAGLEVESTNGWTHAELMQRVSDLAPGTLVLQGAFNQDIAGQRWNSHTVLRAVSERANAPVLTLFRERIGDGSLGGSVIDLNDLGRQAAEQVIAHLKGGLPWGAGAGIDPTRFHPVVDWQQAQRWQARTADAPEATAWVGRPESLWDSHRPALLAMFAAIVLLSGFSAALLIQARRRVRAETATRRSEARYRRLFEDNPQAMWIVDRVGLRILAVNDAAVALYGYARDRFLRLCMTDLLSHRDDRTAPSLSDWQGPEQMHRLCDGRVIRVSVVRHGLEVDGRAAELMAITDVTERELAREHVAEMAAHRQAILDNVLDAIITIDEHGFIQSFNRAATRIFGYDATEAVGQNVRMLMPEPDRARHDGYLKHYLSTGERRIIGIGRETLGRHKSGHSFPMSLGVSEIDRGGRRQFVGLIRDLSSLRSAQAEAQRLAYFDTLTQLPNRRLLLERLAACVEGSGRSAGALICLDIDGFQAINDLQGHAVGDGLLQQLGQRLVQLVATKDTAARLGADSFALLIDGAELDGEPGSSINSLVTRLKAACERPFEVAGSQLTISACMGISLLGGQASRAEAVLAEAELALDRARKTGPGSSCFFEPAVQQEFSERARLLADLRAALESGGLHLVYQPQLDALGRCIGVEALLRWQHPQRGAISPALFIPLAEESGLILRIGRWVLRQACEMQSRWQGDAQLADLVIAVNVAAQEFHDPCFLDRVRNILANSGANPACLELELTESALSMDLASLAQRLGQLRALGVRVALDDFGTGYSSLGYLRRLPLDQLKIDQSFVREAHCNAQDAAIVRAVVAMSQALGLEVIAEGVELDAQRDLLLALGCQRFQGYLFSRPLPEAQLRATLTSWQRDGVVAP